MGSSQSSEARRDPEMWLNDAAPPSPPTAAWLAGSPRPQEAWPSHVDALLSTLLRPPAPAEGHPTKPPLRLGPAREADRHRPTEEPSPAAPSGGSAVAVGSSADAGRGWPTAGHVGHAARAAPGNRVFCVTSGGFTLALYHAGEEAPAPAAVCGFCGALPREPEEGAPPPVCGSCAQWQDTRAAEITCVHAVEEENGAPALYCCARSGAISKRGLRGGAVCGAVQGHPGWTSCLLVLGRSLLMGSDDGLVREWDLSTGRQTRTLEGPAAGLPVCLLAPRGGAAGTLFCGYNSGAVLVWNLVDSRLLAQAGGRWQGGHSRSVSCLCDGGAAGVFSGSSDSTAGKWDAFTGAALWDPRQLGGWASCMLAWEPAGCLLVGCEDGSIQSRGLLSGEAHQRFEPAGLKAHRAAVTSLLALEAPGWLLSGAADGSIRKWHLGTGELLQSLEGHSGAVMCMVACEAEDSLLSGSSDAALRRWSLRTGQLLHAARVPEGKVTGYVVRAAPEPDAEEPAEPHAWAAIGGPDTPSFGQSCSVGHPLQPTIVGAASRAGMSPGSCDRCAKDVAEGELVHECPLCNYWMCNLCASKDCPPVHDIRTPSKGPASPSLSAKLEEPKNPNVPFRGWMRHQFKVSDIRGKIRQEVRATIAAAHASCADREQGIAGELVAEVVEELVDPGTDRRLSGGTSSGWASSRIEAPATVGELVVEAVEEVAEEIQDQDVAEAVVGLGTDVRPSEGIFGGASGSAAGGPDAAPAGRPPSSATQSQAPPAQADLFTLLDLNGDGVISRTEFEQALRPQSQRWVVSNDWLRSPAPGLGYRCSPDLEDKHPNKLMARWGNEIFGVDMGNNFVRTTTGTIGYLPKVFIGQQVLVLADGPARAAA